MPQLSSKEISKATKKQHDDIHKHPFLILKKSSGSLLLYYLANQQLYHIYNALEYKFTQFDHTQFSMLRSENFSYLHERAEARWDDLVYMQSKNIGVQNDIIPLEPATKKFLIQINQATPHQWLGYFLVRILADLNGGQFVRANLSQIYKQYFMLGGMIKMLAGIKLTLEKKEYATLPNLIDSCNNCCLSQKGTRAYQFPQGIKKELEQVLPKLCNNENQAAETLTATKDAFTFMHGIYDDLHKKVLPPKSGSDHGSKLKII